MSMGPFVDVHFTWFPGGSGRIGERPRGNPQGHRFGGPAFHSTLQISDLDGQIHWRVGKQLCAKEQWCFQTPAVSPH